MRAFLLVFLSLGILGLARSQGYSDETRSIAGEWRVQLDPRRVGETERWFDRELGGRMTLPGSTDQARLGEPNAARPTLGGLYRLYPYEGPAWFQYTVIIPGSWKGKRVSLVLERAHGETKVWVDGQAVPGTQDSLVAPHVHDLGPLGSPGTKRLTIRSDNTPKFDLGSFVSVRYEGTQTNWNGLVGGLMLRAVDAVSIEDLQVFPDLPARTARVRARIANSTGKLLTAKLALSIRNAPGEEPMATAEAEVPVDGSAVVERTLTLGAGARAWDEFSPSLLLAGASVSAGLDDKTFLDEKAVRFGLRSFETSGTRFTLNGRAVFLRGTLECGIFPKTGYPPTSPGEWRRIFRIIKSYGLNFMRFHSWCPPEAAFAAADLEGIFIQAEAPQANVDAGKDPARDAFVRAEMLRMVRTYGQHPSFCLMTLGNEYGGDDRILSKWIDDLKREDPRHLYSSASCGQKTANRQFTEDLPRGIHGPGTDRDFGAEVARQDRPLLGHEIGQWTFYPSFDEIPRYDGVLAARNFERVRDDLRARRMLDLAPAFVRATGLHAVLLYKEEIEVLLRTPGYAGFSLLDLHDYPGQGTALVGPLDPFWNSKGFVEPETHRHYCGPTVPLVRIPKRVFNADETLVAAAELAHFGPADLRNVRPVWTLTDSKGRKIGTGALPARDVVATGTLTKLGDFRVPFEEAPAPCKLTLGLALEGTEFANRWDVWVYPAAAEPTPPAGLVVSRAWDDATRSNLAAGRTVLLFPRDLDAKHALPGRFLPVFWSPIWFPDQVPNTMGILCDPAHPALALFPTEMHTNWQWYDLLGHSRSLILDGLPSEVRPIVGVIDNFARNHRLGNLVEARVGPGRLLLCTIDLHALTGSDPAARQMLRSLYTYASGDAIRPAVKLEPAAIDALLGR
ncbi:sugar-binding domain-containing protein [Aquisphaera insulae]|uniref:sugar-binding domain-containing protein n=1 Tax=Aquisphaera insulae TaxID=2712864 RepID=UPI0013ED24FE|nr:sugar-binding domain-containing protein [Aquisphaera insulae]